jgi:hypothetical protein
MRVLDLFAGTQSLKRHLGPGYTVISVDIRPRSKPDICTDILTWDYTVFNPGDFDVVWMSPPCTEYSQAKTVGERDIEGSNRLVERTLEILHYLNPPVWFIENPQTGKLKDQPFMQGLPYYDVSYCRYGFEYRKQTRIWTNIEGFRPLTCKFDCWACVPNPATGKMWHKVSFANTTRGRVVYIKERYSIPPLLIQELFHIARHTIQNVIHV